jgi:hypothetical protein
MTPSNACKYSFDCLGTPGELRVNDLPVAENDQGSLTRNGLLNEFIVDGSNSVVVRAGSGEASVGPPPGAWITVKIARGRPVCEIDWRAGVNTPYPGSVTRDFVSDTAAGLRLWERAAVLEATPAVFAGAREALRRLASALQNRRLAETLSLLRPKAEHQAVSFGFPLEIVTDETRRFFTEWFAKRGWRLLPIEYDKLRFDLFGGKRVLRLRREDGGHVIESAPLAGETYSMDVLFGHVEHRWTLVL